MSVRWIAAIVLLAGACGSNGDGARVGDPDPARVGPQGRVAQFIVQCEVSHIAFDDPIVLPWQPGKSHQHQFFGNTATNSDPVYERALAADTSCDQRLDTASYWSPTLLDASGDRIDAMSMTAYYRPGDGVPPGDVVAYPPGFMMIAGDASSTSPQPTEVVAWGCGSGAERSDAPRECGADSSLRLWLTFPDCWDGTRLTSFGSGAHLRYSSDGCPTSHPMALPQLQMAIDFPPVSTDGLSLSSGPLESAHADFWNTWDQAKLEREVALCLNRDVVCGLGS